MGILEKISLNRLLRKTMNALKARKEKEENPSLQEAYHQAYIAVKTVYNRIND